MLAARGRGQNSSGAGRPGGRGRRSRQAGAAYLRTRGAIGARNCPRFMATERDRGARARLASVGICHHPGLCLRSRRSRGRQRPHHRLLGPAPRGPAPPPPPLPAAARALRGAPGGSGGRPGRRSGQAGGDMHAPSGSTVGQREPGRAARPVPGRGSAQHGCVGRALRQKLHGRRGRGREPGERRGRGPGRGGSQARATSEPGARSPRAIERRWHGCEAGKAERRAGAAGLVREAVGEADPGKPGRLGGSAGRSVHALVPDWQGEAVAGVAPELCVHASWAGGEPAGGSLGRRRGSPALSRTWLALPEMGLE